MTSTHHFQTSPDYYTSSDLCKSIKNNDKVGSNPRYTTFKQTHFTAGDEEQFQQYRDATNGNLCTSEILENNIFNNYEFIKKWDKYKDLPATAVINTFRYIFNKFKKGIFVKIKDNKLAVFLPFSKNKFINEWADQIQIPKLNKNLRKIYKYQRYWDSKRLNNWNFFINRQTNQKIEFKTDLEIFFNYVNEQQGFNKHGGKYNFKPEAIEHNISTWYANNCILRNEKPINEGDSNVSTMKNMLEQLCEQRKIPDIEFFMNRRDFPILTRDGTEAYYNLWNTPNQPLVSHNYEKYLPILSMSVTDKYADILFPTHEDWARVQSQQPNPKFFLPNCTSYSDEFNIDWNDKKPTAVFRGGTTGCGVTIDTNMRLKVAYISANTPPDNNGIKLIDAGITNWNARVRKLAGNPKLQTIDINNMPPLVKPLTRLQQSEYKYIINIDGHVSAFRLSLELSMGSVILLVESKWKMWFFDMLVPGTHYIPINADLSNLLEKIQWCRDNDEECRQIAINARQFYETYLQKDGILDYMQKILVDLKKQTGTYLYNSISPLDLQITDELKNLSLNYPQTNKQITDISTIPEVFRNYSLLQGIHWIVNMVLSKHNFENIAQKREKIAKNKTGIVTKFSLANFSFAIKTTNDPIKSKENIHEAFIGTKSINNLLKHIPNFVYIFGLYKNENYVSVITEHIEGQSFSDYIKYNFNFREYLLIISQLCLALQVAQNNCAFTHYDLTPWNIIIQRLNSPIEVDYLLEYNKIIRVTTDIIPVIIDYGKSHVVYKNTHYGFINMYKTSTVQDILTLLIKSINDIKTNHNELLLLANFIINTQFRQQPFNTFEDLKTFIYKNGTYTDLISSNKYELEQKSPMDLFKYIKNNFSVYSLQIEEVNTYNSLMDSGNARQVFDYILSRNLDEKITSFTNVFFKCKECHFSRPSNLFFVYYFAQQLYDNLVNVKKDMIEFLIKNNIEKEDYEEIADNVLSLISSIYDPLIKNMDKNTVVYNIPNYFSEFQQAPYTDETFLLPDTILNIITPFTNYNLSDYKDIIEYIFVNKGKYRMHDKDREYYINNFKQLLNTSKLIMQNNSANIKTLNNTAKKIYSNDNLFIEGKDCKETQIYKEKYLRILTQLQ